MGWFSSEDEILAEVKALRREIAELSADRDALKKEKTTYADLKRTREELETLKIEKARMVEANERQERETRHEVGLLRKQVETEQKLATEEAVLQVREENLQADRDRFEDQMKFTTDRFEKEVKYLHDMIGQVLKRLPYVEVNKRVLEGVAAKSNGEDDGE
jgi:hypothetical protein